MIVTGMNSVYEDRFPSFASRCGNVNAPEKVSEKKAAENTAEAKRKKDIYKDTPVRLLGFTNELGTAASELCFASNGIMKHVPTISYIPAVVYIGADSYDKYKRGENGDYEKPSVKSGARELLSQVVTSVLAPTGVVLGVQKGTKKLVEKVGPKMPEGVKEMGKKTAEFLKTNKVTKNIFKNNETIKKAAIVGVSLAALVAVTKPIDKLSEKLFEKTVDPILFRKKAASEAEVEMQETKTESKPEAEIKTKAKAG